jgi:hypothetical protein
MATLTWNGKEYEVVRQKDKSAPYVLRGKRGGRVELVRNLKSGLLLPIYTGKGGVMPKTLPGAFRDDGAFGLREVV